MNIALNQRLTEQWRDALCAYVIHHVLPDHVQGASLNMLSAEHLDRFVLVDTQVTSAVTTSYLSEALACTQTYINAIFNNIEPGYDNTFDTRLQDFWRQGMATYPLWAAYQQLEDYPENYIRPELRQDRTQLFQTLESQLAQGKISDASVQTALLDYLKGYEYQNSISVQSGYIDYIGSQHDSDQGANHGWRNSDYYLLGRDAASPPRYYWRKVAVRLDSNSTYIQPDAWSEWQPIDAPLVNTVIEARLAVYNGRLQLVWMSHDEPISQGAEAETHEYPLKLQMAYQGLDNQWSPAQQLWGERKSVDKGEALNTGVYSLLSLAIAGPWGSDDRLLVVLGDATEGEESTLFSSLRDVLKREFAGQGVDDSTAHARLLTHFAQSGAASLKFQYRLASSDLVIAGVSSSPGADLKLEMVLEETKARTANSAGTHRLHLRGLSTQVLTQNDPFHVSLACPHVELTDKSVLLQARLLSNEQGSFTFVCTTNTKPVFQEIELLHKGTKKVGLLSSVFASQPSYGWFEARTTVNAADVVDLMGYSAQQIREGAEFAVRVREAAVGDPQPMAASGNFVRSTASFQSKTVELKVGASSLYSGTLVFNGAAATPWKYVDLTVPQGQGVPSEQTVTFGPTGAQTTFKVMFGLLSAVTDIARIERQTTGAEFFLIGNVQARLNSQQITDLINRAQYSPWRVFEWEAQQLQEPTYRTESAAGLFAGWQRADDDPAADLYDAYGLYLRELFLHVPHLIATRLQEEERFEEARRWLGLVFDPQHKQAATVTAAVDYWKCAWILREGSKAAGLDHQLSDPHVIALHEPVHYRKAVFVQYVQLLIDEADLNYRRQTRDSLAHAWLLYRMAADLMGEAPVARSINTWQARSVDELLDRQATGQRFAPYAQGVVPANLPRQLDTFFWVGAAAHPDFRLPINEQLLDVWRLLAQRFYNLRHYLTIDGAAMQLPLYAPPINPLDLLMARMGGSADLSHLLGYRAVVPPYRFRTLVAKAHDAVGALLQFGEQMRLYLEQEDRTQLELLQFEQAAQIADYTIAIQDQLYQQQLQNQQALQAQRTGIEVRRDHYSRLYQENISANETAAMALAGTSRVLNGVQAGMMTGGHIASLAPNVFGLANGGMEYKGAFFAVGAGLEGAAVALAVTADVMREKEGYRRRREEWELQVKVAQKELTTLETQLEAQQHATQAAANALEQSRKTLAHAQHLYGFYQNKNTNLSLYQWLRTQLNTAYSALYDVAVTLCNHAEACWQFETGNYGKRIVRTPLWRADRYGLNAGAELRLDLLRLESEVLQHHEHHLQVRKTVSLRELIAQGLVFDKGGAPLATWAALQGQLVKEGEAAFTLSETLFNRDYPGHYLRRLHSIAVTLPALLGPYQHVRATLAQTQSRLLTAPDIEGVKFLSTELGAEEGSPRNVMVSLRGGQQVCLSSGNQDDGMFTGPEIDERYRVFENTGAVSSWSLRLPNHGAQGDLLASLSDIIIELQYFARHGGDAFEKAVGELLEGQSTIK